MNPTLLSALRRGLNTSETDAAIDGAIERLFASWDLDLQNVDGEAAWDSRAAHSTGDSHAGEAGFLGTRSRPASPSRLHRHRRFT